MHELSVRSLIGACAAALVLAFISPAALPLSLIILAVPIIIVLLYTWAGPAPALLYGLGTLAVTGFLFGIPACCAAMVAFVIPPAVTLSLIGGRKGYLKCMAASVLCQTVMLILALAVLWLSIRVNLVDALMDQLARFMKAFPSPVSDQLMIQFGQRGLFSTAAGALDFTKGYLTNAERPLVIDMYCSILSEGLKAALPANILSSGIYTGILECALPYWIFARRGDLRGEGRIPVPEWRMPHNAAIGLPACMLAANIMYRSGLDSGYAAYLAVRQLFLILLDVQAVGAVNRLLKKSGSSRTRRMVLTVLLLLFAEFAMHIIGAVSLYIGSKGLLTEFIRKRTNNDNNDGEDQ